MTLAPRRPRRHAPRILLTLTLSMAVVSGCGGSDGAEPSVGASAGESATVGATGGTGEPGGTGHPGETGGDDTAGPDGDPDDTGDPGDPGAESDPEGEPAPPGSDTGGPSAVPSPSTITPGEITPPEVLGHLLEDAPDVAARVDYNTGAGTIAVNYVGTQTVVLSTAGTWGDLALTACEAAARYARAIDAGAAIEVRDGMPGDARTPVRATLRPDAERCTRP